MELMKLRQQQHKGMLDCRLKKVLGYLVLVSLTIMANTVTAQNDGFVYAITNFNTTGRGWNAVRKLDLKTGEFTPVLLNGSDTKLEVYDALTKKISNAKLSDVSLEKNSNAPFGTGVAAVAFDKKNNRLYFTPMAIDQLRYIDLNSMKLYYVTDHSLRTTKSKLKNKSEIITRMTFAPDGNGYALSSDGNTFVRFTTGEKVEITQLGPLTDDASNPGVSIHDHCSCGGGDMVADDDGHLYIFSTGNSIYKVDIENKTAKFLGAISGLPKKFNTEGAAVTAEGKVLISSAANGNGYFVVDPKNWKATPYEAKGTVLPSFDLANSNYLQTKAEEKTPETDTSAVVITDDASQIKLFPNPVVHNHFTVQFGKMIGVYQLEIRDLMGQLVLQRVIEVNTENQQETISFKSGLKGVHLVRIMGTDKKEVFNQKIIVVQ